MANFLRSSDLSSDSVASSYPQPRKPAASSRPPTVLAVAGYDPSAGAGILADLKTLAAQGVYGMACITALTVQSTQGVRRVQGVDASIVAETLECLMQDACFSAIKVGMLGDGEIASAVADWLEKRPEVPAIVDPVLKSSSGKDLVDESGLEILRGRILARADWITPNLAELAVLTDASLPTTRPQAEEFAKQLIERAERSGNSSLKVVVTGGHWDGPADDLLLTSTRCRWYSGERIETRATHGTGCTFSSALAARIAWGEDPETAVQRAKEYVAGALRHAYPVGQGADPLNHFWQQPIRRAL